MVKILETDRLILREFAMEVALKVGLTYWKDGVFKGIAPCRVYSMKKPFKT